MSRIAEQILLRLTDTEAAQLDSDDEEFYGFSEQPSLPFQTAVGPSTSGDMSDTESEEGDCGILPECELQERISVVARRRGEGESQERISVVARERGEGESLASQSIGIVSPESDPLYSKINQRLVNGCSCSDSCLTRFTTEEVFVFHLSLCEMLILGKLQAISRVSDSTQHARQSKAGKRKRVTCEYCFDDRIVCKDGFLFLYDLGTKQLENLQQHLKANGPVPREHGLTGHVPATTYPFKVVNDAAHFIRNYAEVYGIPQPAARSGRANNPPIYLPAYLNYKIMHSKYVEACQSKAPHTRFLAYKSFVGVVRAP